MFVSAGAADNSRTNKVAKELGLQGRAIWFDAEANLWELSTREGVAETVAHCKAANINTIIVDVKPLSGLVLWDSKIAPKLTRWDGRNYPAGHDLLREVIEEGHKAGIRVHAALNIFSEGSSTVGGTTAERNPEWQCVQYEMDRFLVGSDGTSMKVNCAQGAYVVGDICIYGDNASAAGDLPQNTTYVRIKWDGSIVDHGKAGGRFNLPSPEDGFLLLGNGIAGDWLQSCADKDLRLHIEGRNRLVRVGELRNVHNATFVNPVRPDVRAYELSLIKEICERYPVDGIVLDRMRYPNIYADFSVESREAFEEFIGSRVENWPHDVFRRRSVPGDDIVRGPLFKSWLKFRASVTRSFLAEARKTIKAIKPEAKVGIYVGSWYPLYYDVGVNWGSRSNAARHEWWPEGYEETGYADLVDYMCTGCYYAHPTRKDAVLAGDEEWKSVEAAAEESINAVKDDTFVYGSLYLYQYNTRPDRFVASLKQCLEITQGCMIFDLVYLRKYDWWGHVESAFSQPKEAPHDVPGLIESIREKK